MLFDQCSKITALINVVRKSFGTGVMMLGLAKDPRQC